MTDQAHPLFLPEAHTYPVAERYLARHGRPWPDWRRRVEIVGRLRARAGLSGFDVEEACTGGLFTVAQCDRMHDDRGLRRHVVHTRGG